MSRRRRGGADAGRPGERVEVVCSGAGVHPARTIGTVRVVEVHGLRRVMHEHQHGPHAPAAHLVTGDVTGDHDTPPYVVRAYVCPTCAREVRMRDADLDALAMAAVARGSRLVDIGAHGD